MAIRRTMLRLHRHHRATLRLTMTMLRWYRLRQKLRLRRKPRLRQELRLRQKLRQKLRLHRLAMTLR